MLRWLALIYLGISLLGILLLRDSKKKTIEVSTAKKPMLPHLKSKVFLQLFVSCFCSVIGGLYIVFSYKNFGRTKIDDDKFLSLVGSIGSIFNGGLRLLWGYMMDKYSFKKTFMCLLVIQLCLLGSLFFIVQSKAAYLIWIAFILICEGGNFALFPGVHSYIWGKELGAKMYSIFFFVFPVALICCYVIQLFLVPRVGYMAMYLLLTGINFIGILVMVTFKPEKIDLDSDAQNEMHAEDPLVD